MLLPDGRVVLVPDYADRVGLYDPSTDAWTQGKDSLAAAGAKKYRGGVLLPDGRVVLVPRAADRVWLYDPSTDAWTQGKDSLAAAGAGKYAGGVLLPRRAGSGVRGKVIERVSSRNCRVSSLLYYTAAFHCSVRSAYPLS